MKHIIYVLIFIGNLTVLSSCMEKSDPAYDQENFTSIFDNNQFSGSYYPIDFKQTTNGGYIILGEIKVEEGNFRGVYLLKVDKFGKYVASVQLDYPYVSPVGELIASGNQYYFFCMDATNVQAQLVSVDAEAFTTTITPVGGLTYPQAASADGNTLLLLSYDQENKETAVSRLQTSGASGGTVRKFTIGEGDKVEEPIMNHFIHTGKRFPFFIGRIPGGRYYFNGFQKYSFSLVFTALTSDENESGDVVNGSQDDGGLSAVYHLGGNKFAAARFNFGANYFLPNVTLSTIGASKSDQLGGKALPELVSDAPVKIIKAIINGKNMLIYASDTRSKQIGLFFYEEATGVFLGSRYLGFSNPFEIGAIATTADDGLAVCGTTYLAGRFPRICLIKLSDEELRAAIK
jgi:hypothetical protein